MMPKLTHLSLVRKPQTHFISKRVLTAILIGVAAVAIVASTVSVFVSIRPKRNRRRAIVTSRDLAAQRRVALRNLQLCPDADEFELAADALVRGGVDEADMTNLLSSAMHGVRTPPMELYTSRVFARTDSSHFTIDIEDSRDYPVVSCELLRAVLPSGSYTIESDYNDAVIVSVEDSAPVRVTVPQGVYNVVTLAATLESALTDAQCGFKVSISSLNHRCTISLSKSFTLSFPDTGSLAYELGFGIGEVISAKDVGCDHVVTGPYRVDIGAPRYVYLVTSELDGRGMHPAGVMAEIPIVSQLQYTDYAAHAARRRKFAQAIRLRQLTCTLMKPASRRPPSSDASRVTRHDLVPFNLHGIAASFTIELTRVRPLHHKVHSVASLPEGDHTTNL